MNKKLRKLLKKHLRLRKRKLLPSKFKRSPRMSHLSRSRQWKVKSPRPNLLRRRSLPRLKQKMHHQQKKSQPLPKLNINRKSKPNRMSQRPRRLLRRHHLKSPLNRQSPRPKKLPKRLLLKSKLRILLQKLMPRIQPILPCPLASKRLKRTPRSKKCQKRRMKRKMSDSNL